MTNSQPISGGAPNSSITALYREYLHLTTEAEATLAASHKDEDLAEAIYEVRDQVEARLMAIPCITAADLAAKFIVETARGTVYYDYDTSELWREARTLIRAASVDLAKPASEIMRLFGEWRTARAVIESDFDTLPEGAFESAPDDRDDLEAEMVELTPTSGAEVAALVLAMTQWGEQALLNYGFGDKLVATLKALAGCHEEYRP